MAVKTVEMTAPNGAKVRVAEDRVENLVRSGFAKVKAPPKKSASSSKSKN